MANIYWREGDIPALRGLPAEECRVAKRRVRPEVLQHWQVWLSFAALAAVCVAMFINALHFAHHSGYVAAILLPLSRLAVLPYHHFMQYHLSQGVLGR
jgi:hypothetical protein